MGSDRQAPVGADPVQPLLARHPNAVVAALNVEGLIVDMPGTVPLNGHHVAQGRSAIDLFVAADRAVAVQAWHHGREHGIARATVRLISDPDSPTTLHVLNTLNRHGVLLVVLIPTSESVHRQAGQPAVAAPPRFARIRKDMTAVIIGSDEATTRILGWSEDELIGRRALELVHPDDQALAIDNWMELLAVPGPGRRVRLRHRCREGSWVWFEVTNYNRLDDPTNPCVYAEMVDISAEMAAQEALQAREELLARLTESLPLGVVQLDRAHNVIYSNARLFEILRLPEATTLDQLQIAVDPADRPAFCAAFANALVDGQNRELEIRLQSQPGHGQKLCRLTVRALHHDTRTINGAVACLTDVTDSARMRRELEHRATYDILTGCHNRQSVCAELHRLLHTADRVTASLGTGAFFIDIDLFKTVNDTHGHAVGDELLVLIADRLSQAIRDGDILGRLGGDEFLIVCPQLPDEQAAAELGTRFAAVLSGTARLSTCSVPLRASIGIAWAAAGQTDTRALIAQADQAMYQSKRQCRGQPALTSPAGPPSQLQPRLRHPSEPAETQQGLGRREPRYRCHGPG